MRIRKQYQVIPTNAKLENGHSTSDKNGYTCEYINSLNETEIIRNNAGLVLEKNGNIIHFYTAKYISQGTLENYTIPEQYQPKNTMQVPCMAYYTGSYWQPRHIGNKTTSLGKFQVESASGNQDTSYIYMSFSLTWFI